MTCDLLVAGCEISFPHQRRNLNPLRWERGVLATGLTSESSIAVTSAVSDSVRPHRWQPTRLPRLWDSLGKNTGVGCHLLQCIKVKSESEVAQSCPTLSNPMDCSLPGSSVHGIFDKSTAVGCHCLLRSPLLTLSISSFLTYLPIFLFGYLSFSH